MLQSSVFDGVASNPFAFQQDSLASAKVDGGRCQVLQAFVIAAVIVVIDEVRDLGFEIAGQVIVLKQNAILEGLWSEPRKLLQDWVESLTS